VDSQGRLCSEEEGIAAAEDKTDEDPSPAEAVAGRGFRYKAKAQGATMTWLGLDVGEWLCNAVSAGDVQTLWSRGRLAAAKDSRFASGPG
jgi:hypothetical protein